MANTTATAIGTSNRLHCPLCTLNEHKKILTFAGVSQVAAQGSTMEVHEKICMYFEVYTNNK